MANFRISLLSKQFFNLIKNQQFSLPVTILRYIFDNATSDQWQKLQKLCKLIFLHHRYLIIRDFKLLSNTSNIFFGKDSLKLSATSPIFPYLRNIWFTGTLKVHSNHIHCARLISKIVKCNIHSLIVCHCLCETDFDILTVSGNLEILSINSVVNESGEFLSVEKIISKIPKAHSIEIRRCHVTQKTMQILMGLNHKVKFKVFLLRNIDEFVNVKDYSNFSTINAAKKANLWIDFCKDDSHKSESKKFRAMVGKMLKLWQPQTEKPMFRKTFLI